MACFCVYGCYFFETWLAENSNYGFNEFIICAGYKQHIIKEWLADYFLHTSDITFDFSNGNKMIIYNRRVEP